MQVLVLKPSTVVTTSFKVSGVEDLLYDHKKKVAWWKNAEFLMRTALLPGLIVLSGAGSFFLFRLDFVEVTATVTQVEEVCEARKTRLRGLGKGFSQTERIEVPCRSFKTSIGQGLREDGFRLVKTSLVEFNHVSPADNRMRRGFGELETSEITEGDQIRIGASTKTAGSTVLDWSRGWLPSP